MRRLPLTGLLLLPMACYLLLSAEREISRRPAAAPQPQAAATLDAEPERDHEPASRPLRTRARRRGFSLCHRFRDDRPGARRDAARTAPLRATGSIPNIDAEGLLAALTRAGLECSSVSLDTGRLTWTCSSDTPQASYLVVVNGARTDAITRLQATVSRAESDFLAVRFLAGMAGLTYTGAEPARAADWVKRNISGGDSIRIGPVQFALSGAPGARSLDVVAVGGQP